MTVCDALLAPVMPMLQEIEQQRQYWLFVAPVVLGSGRPLFQAVQESLRLKLVETRQLLSGVVLLQYDIGGEPRTSVTLHFLGSFLSQDRVACVLSR